MSGRSRKSRSRKSSSAIFLRAWARIDSTLGQVTMSGGEPELRSLGTAPTLKRCAACGEEFSCGAPVAGCWCEEVQVAAEVLVALRARCADCLCRRCLTAAATSSTRSVLHSDSESTSTGRSILPLHFL